jgi:hypothetical protein
MYMIDIALTTEFAIAAGGRDCRSADVAAAGQH